VGVVVTCIIQSSSASIALVQVIAQQGLLTLEMSLFICLGCAIGTCVTAMLASIGASRNARRAAVFHLLYNILGSSLMLLMLQFVPLADWMRAITKPGDIMRQIANAMMLMKAVEILLFVWFTPLLVKASLKLVPGEDPTVEENSVMYLDERLLATPAIAIAQAVKEVERMGEVAVRNLDLALDLFVRRDESRAEEVMRDESLINFLNHEITTYLVGISQETLTPGESSLVGALYHVINDLERIGDHAENIVGFTSTALRDDTTFSESALAELAQMRGAVNKLLRLSMTVFSTRDRSLLGEVYDLEETVDDMEENFQQKHIDRLSAGACTPQSGMLFSDLLSNLERVADHATNVAFSIASDEHIED
jgi:phosphate:Na+ symporter